TAPAASAAGTSTPAAYAASARRRDSPPSGARASTSAPKIKASGSTVALVPIAAATRMPPPSIPRPVRARTRTRNAANDSAMEATSGIASRLSATRSISTATMVRASSSAGGLARRRNATPNAPRRAPPDEPPPQPRRPEAHVGEGEDHVGAGLEHGGEDQVQGGPHRANLPEQPQRACVGDPAALIGDVAVPLVIVRIGVETGEAKDDAPHEDREGEAPREAVGHRPRGRGSRRSARRL